MAASAYSACSKIAVLNNVNRHLLKPVTSSVNSTTMRTNMFWSPDRKGGYDPHTPQATTLEKLKLGFSMLGSEFKLLAKEVKSGFKADTDPMYMDSFFMAPYSEHGSYKVVWKFRGNEDIEKFIVTSDQDHGEGYSEALFSVSKENRGLFHGRLDTRVPKDGKISNAGYCNIRSQKNYVSICIIITCIFSTHFLYSLDKFFEKSFKRESPHAWHNYTHLVIRCRGDGRPYLINMDTKCNLDVIWHDQYNFTLYTRGGPYWQTSKIPFSKFFLTTKGRIQDKQNAIELGNISTVSITQADRQTGPFALEIDYIAVIRDVHHKEEFWWEMYEGKAEMMY